jgi:hypothetical protein
LHSSVFRICGGLKQRRVIRTNPVFHILAQRFRNSGHFLDFPIRNASANVVIAQVAFLAERIEAADELSFFAEREFEGLNDMVVEVVLRRSISCGGQGCGRRLKPSIVGNGKTANR